MGIGVFVGDCVVCLNQTVSNLTEKCTNQEVLAGEIDMTLAQVDVSAGTLIRTNRDKEENFLKTLDSCLDLCTAVLDNSEYVKDPIMNKQDAPI